MPKRREGERRAMTARIAPPVAPPSRRVTAALDSPAAIPVRSQAMFHATYSASTVSTMAMAMCLCCSVPVGCCEERRID